MLIAMSIEQTNQNYVDCNKMLIIWFLFYFWVWYFDTVDVSIYFLSFFNLLSSYF